jgi:hypothetical protein
MFDCIKIAQATYYWSAAATAINFKHSLWGKAIDWLNYIKDTKQIDISLWSRIEPQFKTHYVIQIQTVDNIWYFSKLKQFEIKDVYTFHVCWGTANHSGSNKEPQNTYDENVYQQICTYIHRLCAVPNPDSLNTSTNTARAKWKWKNPAGYGLPKVQFITMSPITPKIENSLEQLL